MINEVIFVSRRDFIGNHVQKKKFAAEFFKNSHQNFSRKSSRRYSSNQLSAVFSTDFAAAVFSLTLDNSFFFGKVGGFKTIRDRAASLTVGDQMLVLGGRDPTGSDLISFEVNLFNRQYFAFQLYLSRFVFIFRSTTMRDDLGKPFLSGKWLRAVTG